LTLIILHQDWGTLLFDDGLHFNADGNQIVFDKVIEAIKKDYPHLRTESMLLHFPDSSFLMSQDAARKAEESKPMVHS
jgi:hypothetical protein